MPIQILRNDLTHMRVDAIVNAGNHALCPGGGVSGAIFRAGGPALAQACRALGGCATGEAKLTPGFGLPCRYVIHTVGPVWRGGRAGEREALAGCYRACLTLAQAQGLETVAFPLISSGHFGFPREVALRTALDAITGFLLERDGEGAMTVFLVLFGSDAVRASRQVVPQLESFIDDNYVQAHPDRRPVLRRAPVRQTSRDAEAFIEPEAPCACAPCVSDEALEDALARVDESFSQMVMRKLKEKGMTPKTCYWRANIDRKLFSKIRNDPGYQPKKTTALALAVALELTLPETRELLGRAGYALTHSSRGDIIVEYYLRQGEYDIYEINAALFDHHQPTLGASMD